MAEHKSPYTGEQVDKMVDTTNYTLYPALNNSGPNLDTEGNENLSNPTNSPDKPYAGTFTEFKTDILKLLDRSYLKDYFTINTDNSVTINIVKLFRQFAIRKDSTGSNYEVYIPGTIPENGLPDIANRLFELSANEIKLGFWQAINGQIKLTPTAINLYTCDSLRYLIRQSKSLAGYLLKMYEPNSGDEILVVNYNGTVNFKQPNGKELMFCDYNGKKVFGMSAEGEFKAFYKDAEWLAIGSDGVKIKKFDNVNESNATKVTVMKDDGLIGAIPVSWFAKSTELAEVRAIAEGAGVAYAFNSVAELDNWLANGDSYPINAPEAMAVDMKVGTNLFIINTYESDYWWDGTAKQMLSGDSGVFQRSNSIAVYGGAARNYSVVFTHPLPSDNYIITFTAKTIDARFRIISQTANGFVVEITPNADAHYSGSNTTAFDSYQTSYASGFYTDPLNYDLIMPYADSLYDLFIVNGDGTLTARTNIVGTLNIASSTITGTVDNTAYDETENYEWNLSTVSTSILGHSLQYTIDNSNAHNWTLNIPAQSFSVNIPAGTIIPKSHIAITTTKFFDNQTVNVDWWIQGTLNASYAIGVNLLADYTAYFATSKVSM